MSHVTNLVSAALTPDQAQEVRDAIQHLKTLCGFAVSLNAQEKTWLLYPGAQGVEACERMTETVSRFSDRFPASVCDASEMREDLNLVKALKEIIPALKEIVSALEDTEQAAASDLFRASLQAYAIAKTMTSVTPGLESAIEPLKKHLDRRGRRASTKASPPSNPA